MSGIPLSVIAETCAAVFGIPKHELLAHRRDDTKVQARWAFVLLAYELTDHSSAAIGLHLDGRDHSTILHARKRATEHLAASADFSARVDLARELIPRLLVAKLARPAYEPDGVAIAMAVLTVPRMATSVSIEQISAMARALIDARSQLETAETIIDRLEQVERCAAGVLSAEQEAAEAKYTVLEARKRAELRDAKTVLKFALTQTAFTQKEAANGQITHAFKNLGVEFSGAAKSQ